MAPPLEDPARPRRFGERWGCFVVVLFLAALAGSLVFALRNPLPGLVLVGFLAALGVWLLRYASAREHEEDARQVARLRAVSQPSGAGWRALFEHEGLGRSIERIRAHVRPAVRLTTRRDDGTPEVGRSRVGGAPDLPADVAWPEHAGLPMMFLAQIDLAEVCSLPGAPLPGSGHLWFFYSVAEPWGFDPEDAGATRVIHRPLGTRLVPTAPPSALPAEFRFPACTVAFEAYEDLPDLDEQPWARELDDAASERYVELRDYLSSGGGGPQHKLLGHADPVQSTMEFECQLVTNGISCGDPSGYDGPRAAALKAGSADWRLLLQLDSDDAAGWMWGDAGRLYFWIREHDLRERRFDKVWLIQQCH